MPFATWWRGDALPDLPPLPELAARRETDLPLLEPLTRLSPEEIERRFQGGHDVYVAYLDGTPAGYGWLARRQGDIHELALSFRMPPGNGYLWDFVTLPEYRGRGVYPHLLQAIIRHEPAIERFWIGFAAGNEASGRGIRKAGFEEIGDMVIEGRRVAGVRIDRPGERGREGARILGQSIVEDG
jgi:GNAT superfamily N-acetyltransferase